MGDYISREAAKEALYKTAEEYDEYDKCDRIAIVALNNADKILNDIPAADVVEVVRCQECVFGNMPCAMARYPDYFCADGKRKDGGQDDV